MSRYFYFVSEIKQIVFIAEIEEILETQTEEILPTQSQIFQLRKKRKCVFVNDLCAGP